MIELIQLNTEIYFEYKKSCDFIVLKLKTDSGEVPEINSGTLACMPSCKLGNWLYFDDGSYKKRKQKVRTRKAIRNFFFCHHHQTDGK